MARTTRNRLWTSAIGIIVVVGMVFFVNGRRGQQQVEAQGGALTEALPGGGGQVDVAAPIMIIASDLPVVTGAAGGPVRMHEEHLLMPEDQFEAAKEAAARGFGPTLPVTASAPTRAGGLTPFASVSFDGDFEGEAGCGNWVPADQALAVGDGANPIIQVVNECLSVWNLAGARILGPVSLQSFFGTSASTSVCDPRALFDWKNHRFIVQAITCSAPYTSKVAVSTSDSATGGWFIYTFSSVSSSGALMDYPRMGQDHTSTYPGSGFPGAIYIAYNLFNPGYIQEEWIILPKGPMYAGAGFSYWAFWGMTSGGGVTDSTQPANVWSPYERPRAEFLVTSKNSCGSPCNAITVWAISNPFTFVSGGQSPELTGVVITAANTWTIPPNAPQNGGPNTIETLDNRFTGEATYAHGHVHVAHSTANGAGGTASEIYKIQPFLNVTNGARCTAGVSLGLCPQITGALIRNETVLNYGGTVAAFFATPQPDLDGNVTTVLNYSTTAEFPSIVYISQRVTQPPGTFVDGGVYLANGIGRYTSQRWGDYMAVSPIGVAYQAGNGGATGGNAFVFSGMYSDSTANNRWRTRVGANIFTTPGQAGPKSGSPASVIGDSVAK